MAFNKGYVKEKMEGFRRFTPLLRELVVRDIKVRYRHSALGLQHRMSCGRYYLKRY